MTTPTAHIDIHTDSDLLAQTAQGSTEAFTELFYRYKDSLHRLSWSITGSRTIADDVLQEVFLKIWLKRNDLVNVQNFHGYLVVVTRRVLLNELRRLGRLKSLDNHPDDAIVSLQLDSIEDRMQEKQFAELVERGTQHLSAQQSAVFRLVKVEGMTREQAARQLQLSPETVKTHLERAMRHLRAFLLLHVDDPLLWLVVSVVYLSA
jgi:RNA polymerase sigma-70 factor (ECF subfamily)